MMDNEPMADIEWLTLTPRQIEMQLWQLILDMGGEVSTIPPADDPLKRVMFYADGGGYLGMIAQTDYAEELERST